MLTIKSDDRVGRRKAYEAIIKQHEIPKAGMPEAFKVFTKELKGLCMNVTLYNQDDEVIDTDVLAKMALIEERKVNSAIRSAMSPREQEIDASIDETPVDVAEQAALAEEEGLSVSYNPSGVSDDE